MSSRRFICHSKFALAQNDRVKNKKCHPEPQRRGICFSSLNIVIRSLMEFLDQQRSNWPVGGAGLRPCVADILKESGALAPEVIASLRKRLRNRPRHHL